VIEARASASMNFSGNRFRQGAARPHRRDPDPSRAMVRLGDYYGPEPRKLFYEPMQKMAVSPRRCPTAAIHHQIDDLSHCHADLACAVFPKTGFRFSDSCFSVTPRRDCSRAGIIFPDGASRHVRADHQAIRRLHGRR